MRYYFHVRHHDLVLEDLVGAELASIDMVREEAFESACDLIADRMKGKNPLHVDTIFEVRDEDGDIVHMLPFAAVLLSFLASDGRSVLSKTESNPTPPHGATGQRH